MPTDDQTPGQEGAEQATELTGQQAQAATHSSDPLDDIQDPDARAEAKKFRAIARRNEKKDDTALAQAPATPSGDFVTKGDVARIVTSQAKDLVSEDVRANWDELTAIPLAGYDAMDPKSIARNMTERFALYAARKGTPTVNGAADLQVTKSLGTAGTAAAPASPDLHLPGYAKQKGPADWYAKP